MKEVEYRLDLAIESLNDSIQRALLRKKVFGKDAVFWENGKLNVGIPINFRYPNESSNNLD